jgi:peroxiredoxin
MGGRMIVIACAAVLAAAALSTVTTAEERMATADFRLKNLEGRSVSLHQSLADGPVLIAFWATWCKPCLQELPRLSEMTPQWSEKGLTVQAISIDKARSHGRVRSYAHSQDFAFDVLLDPNQEAFRKLQGSSVPFLVLLDSTGEKRLVKVGYRPGDEHSIAAAVDSLFASVGNGAADGAEASGDAPPESQN